MDKQEIRHKNLQSIKAKEALKRTFSERMADFMTGAFGSMTFLVLNAVFFLFWILVNTNYVSGVPAFDPYPFNLLTMVVSLEAIFLAVFVLISQNRSAKVDDLREETNLQFNLIEAKELSKVIKIFLVMAEKQGIDLSKDPELTKMSRPISEEAVEKRLEKEIL